MRILHTADWHLGKRLQNRERIEEQIAVLDEITHLARSEKVDIIVIAGDIFDTTMPSAAAEELFFSTVVRMGLDSLVIAISGNHDDPTRLAAAKDMAKYCNVVLAGDHNLNLSGSKVKQSGVGFVKAQINDEIAVINILPYPNDSRMGEKIDENSTFSQRVSQWLLRGASQFSRDSINITTSHVFCVGGEKGKEERDIELGTARILPLNVFPAAHYTALGHIHKPQTISREQNIHYSGSILQYTFEEKTEKSVIITDITKEGVKEFSRIPLSCGKKLQVIEIDNILAADEKLKGHENKWVWLDMKLEGGFINATDIKKLKTQYPNIVKFNLIKPQKDNSPVTQKQHKTDKEIFIEYYRKTERAEPSEQLVNLFLELMGEEL